MPIRFSEELVCRYITNYALNVANGVDMGTTWTNIQTNYLDLPVELRGNGVTIGTLPSINWGATNKLKERVTKLGNKLD